jgi:hypothetical protein
MATTYQFPAGYGGCFIQRAKRYGFTDTVYNVAGLREHSDRTLFKSLQIEGHCLASILPPVRSNVGELRNRGHIFTLPKCSTVAYIILICLDACSILFNCRKFVSMHIILVTIPRGSVCLPKLKVYLLTYLILEELPFLKPLKFPDELSWYVHEVFPFWQNVSKFPKDTHSRHFIYVGSTYRGHIAAKNGHQAVSSTNLQLRLSALELRMLHTSRLSKNTTLAALK